MERSSFEFDEAQRPQVQAFSCDVDAMERTMKILTRPSSVLLTAVVFAAAALGSAPAEASPRSLSESSAASTAEDGRDALNALDERDLLASGVTGPEAGIVADESVPSGEGIHSEGGRDLASEELDDVDGLTVSTPQGSLSLAPVTESTGEEVQPGVLLYEGEHADYVLTSSEKTAAAAGYVVVKGAAAPEEYRFAVTAAGADAHLELTSSGGITVSDSLGNVVNTIAEPWAVDADGAPVDTWYEIDGAVVVQHVQHAGATYPVVADPSLECDAAFCTLLYSRAETQRIASESSFPVAVATAACGTVGWACGLGLAAALDTANRANNAGKCFGIRHFHYVAVAFFPVVEPCKE
ncbi:hypothetical protein [Rathayibacter sp. PhB151]|uniref:hypothetical protein n=1 Tax=Rathayibacter sp. PhB151 TaxID=2485189 RepID=UPI001063778D|nr:hypothetical protein [Rathayibacter sp. PhB151]